MIDDDRQLKLMLEEYGENKPHISKLRSEAKAGYPLSYQPLTVSKPVVIDPWPPHMRFD